MINDNLSEIYEKGIKKTWWKSKVLEKNNTLRDLLDMPNRETPVGHRQYDSEVTNKLSNIDFSPLDQGSYVSVSNFIKWGGLNFAGIGYTPASLVGEVNQVEDYNYDHQV